MELEGVKPTSIDYFVNNLEAEDFDENSSTGLNFNEKRYITSADYKYRNFEEYFQT